MKKIKTATVTWINFNNYGTYLQAYALQQILKKLGYCNKIISDKPVINSIQSNKDKVFFILKDILHFIRKIYSLKYRKLYSISKYYKEFKQKYLEIDDDWKNLKSLDCNYDIFICGSDQIWSPNAVSHPFYYLGFTDKKKISYAPSMGVEIYPQNKIELVKKYLKNFNHLSVREKQGSYILKNSFGLDSKVVVDPTLLLNKNDWEIFINKSLKEDYVLVYLLTYNEGYLSFIKEFAKSKGLTLKIFIVNDIQTCKFADECLYVGPQEFLNKIYNSTYFFTDSFHGSIFALQFEKQFYVLKRFKTNALNNQNIRIDNLLDTLDLHEYFLSEEEIHNIYSLPRINYLDVQVKLMQERYFSLEYLKNALNN